MWNIVLNKCKKKHGILLRLLWLQTLFPICSFPRLPVSLSISLSLETGRTGADAYPLSSSSSLSLFLFFSGPTYPTSSSVLGRRRRREKERERQRRGASVEIASIEHFFSLLTGKKICARKASEKRRFPGPGKLRRVTVKEKEYCWNIKKARIFPAGEREAEVRGGVCDCDVFWHLDNGGGRSDTHTH